MMGENESETVHWVRYTRCAAPNKRSPIEINQQKTCWEDCSVYVK